MGSHRRGGELRQGFLDGNPDDVALVSSTISRVILVNGYYIPAGERADVLQEALADLVREARARPASGDPEFCALVRVVAHRRCVDWLRRRRATDRVGLDTTYLPGPEQRLLDKERQHLGIQVIEQLEEPCRRLFALHAGLGLTYREIGESLGRSEGSLRTQLYECLQHARKILARIRRSGPAGPQGPGRPS